MEVNNTTIKQEGTLIDLKNYDEVEQGQVSLVAEPLEASLVEQNIRELSTRDELPPNEINKLTRALKLPEIKTLMNDMGLDERFIFQIAKETALLATKANPKTGEEMPDFDTRLKAIQFMAKLRKLVDKEPNIIIPLFTQYNGKG